MQYEVQKISVETVTGFTLEMTKAIEERTDGAILHSVLPIVEGNSTTAALLIWQTEDE